MIKVIIMDIDGTLVNNKKEMTPETRDALLKAQEHGTLLILASGRPYNGLVKLGKELKMDKHNGLFVCFNGSKVVNFQTGETLFNKAISKDNAKDIFEHLKKYKGCRPMVDKGDYMYVNDVFDCYIQYPQGPEKFVDENGRLNVMQYESRGNSYKLCEIDDLAAWCNQDVNKILTYGEPEYLKVYHEEIYAPFKDKVNAMFTGPFYYEFTAKGIDKTEAIKSVLKPLGYTAKDVAAFGDAQNDKTMVEFAGLGVAMGNATDELKAVADEITDSNENDGIAKSLYRNMPEVFG